MGFHELHCKRVAPQVPPTSAAAEGSSPSLRSPLSSDGPRHSERPSISALTYMILRSPLEFLRKPDSKNAKLAAEKLER